MGFRLLCTAVAVVLVPASVVDAAVQRTDEVRDEESTDYYKRWLERDVLYIATDQERDVFHRLQTPEEKDAFIEQFWIRRDPDPTTRDNEFKEEHYRRIAYANEFFASGYEGWATERGRIYIVFGPPRSIERNPTGGTYLRSAAEGGGETMTYPHETWYYDHLEAIGTGLTLEFVDRSYNGDYRLARHPLEKDALIDKPGSGGMTLDEAEGRASRYYRLDTLLMGRPSHHDGYPGEYATAQPLEDLARYFQLLRPPDIKFQDLQRVVTSRVLFDSSLDVGFTYQRLHLDENHVLVRACFSVPSHQLTALDGFFRVNIYGRVNDLTGTIAYEFEDTLAQDAIPGEGSVRFLYEKKLPLRSGRFKLSAVLKDEHSERITVLDRLLEIPAAKSDHLSLSSINLIDRFVEIDGSVPLTEPFVIPGGKKAFPNVTHRIDRKNRRLGVHFEVYGFALGSDTGLPVVEAQCTLYDQKGRIALDRRLTEPDLKIVGRRMVAILDVNLAALATGKYQLAVDATDRLTGQDAAGTAEFTLH